MKLLIKKDDWYPVFCLHDNGTSKGTDVPEELWLEWNRIEKEFDEIQEKIRELYEESR